MDLGAASTEAEQESTNRFINGELSELYRLLRDDAQSIDTKATLVAGFAAAAITFLLNARRGPTWWAAVAAYGFTLGSAFAALWPRQWDALTPSVLESKLGDATPVLVTGRVAGSKALICERNKEDVGRKTVLWVASVVMLTVSVFLSVCNTVVESSNG